MFAICISEYELNIAVCFLKFTQLNRVAVCNQGFLGSLEDGTGPPFQLLLIFFILILYFCLLHPTRLYFNVQNTEKCSIYHKSTWGFLGSLQEGGPRNTFSSSYMFISALNHDIILKWFSYYLFFVSYYLCRHSLFDIVASILLLKDLPRLIVDATLMLFHYRSSSSEELCCERERGVLAIRKPRRLRGLLNLQSCTANICNDLYLYFHICVDVCTNISTTNRTYRPGLL